MMKMAILGIQTVWSQDIQMRMAYLKCLLQQVRYTYVWMMTNRFIRWTKFILIHIFCQNQVLIWASFWGNVSALLVQKTEKRIGMWKMEKIDYFMVSLACSFHKPKSSFLPTVTYLPCYILFLFIFYSLKVDLRSTSACALRFLRHRKCWHIFD